jgi:hypothetical protein
MRLFNYCCFTIVLLSPPILHAGLLYGFITLSGNGVARAKIEINCSGMVTRGVVATDGSYRINVPQKGQCTLVLPDYAGHPSAIIFSGPDPSENSFQLVQLPDGKYELRRR